MLVAAFQRAIHDIEQGKFLAAIGPDLATRPDPLEAVGFDIVHLARKGCEQRHRSLEIALLFLVRPWHFQIVDD